MRAGTTMAAFLYRCPITGFQVQGYSPEQPSSDDHHPAYESVFCYVCAQIHHVNPATGEVLGDDEQAALPSRQRGPQL
jgi:hypothetical protein